MTRFCTNARGRNSVSNLVLTSELSNPALDGIWDWYQNLKMQQYDRRSIQVLIMDSQGVNIARYMALGTWPAAWRVVDAEGQGNGGSVAVEIEFVIEELYRMPVVAP